MENNKKIDLELHPFTKDEGKKFWEQVYCACLVGNITADIDGIGRTSEPSQLADAAVKAWKLRFQ